MVDTLVLGTSAKAWEFESLHAQFLKEPKGSFLMLEFVYVSKIKDLSFSVNLTKNIFISII